MTDYEADNFKLLEDDLRNLCNIVSVFPLLCKIC